MRATEAARNGIHRRVFFMGSMDEAKVLLLQSRLYLHGATPTTAMTHIAVQEALEGKVVDWMEKVSDDEYRKSRVSDSVPPLAL